MRFKPKRGNSSLLSPRLCKALAALPLQKLDPKEKQRQRQKQINKEKEAGPSRSIYNVGRMHVVSGGLPSLGKRK